jgi:signal transduction histidine kinase
LGKTDVEIFHGGGVKESEDFKREVLEKGKASKREITFTTDLFGSKTFLIYVEPVYNKAGEKIGINYMGMEVTDQVVKREKMAKLREDNAVRKAMESELNKTIHITGLFKLSSESFRKINEKTRLRCCVFSFAEETMRAKQMLATMSHEIRSPLSGVVGMAEILSTTKLDKEQRQLLNVMISSGDLVLQLINDILDLSKVESGVMRLEATKFRPREVVKHVLQTAAASLKKSLTLEGNIADDVPIEVTTHFRKS